MTNKQRNEAILVLTRIEESAKFLKESLKEIPEFPNTHMLIANLNKLYSELDFIAGEVDKIIPK